MSQLEYGSNSNSSFASWVASCVQPTPAVFWSMVGTADIGCYRCH